jgi:hypothetical protein
MVQYNVANTGSAANGMRYHIALSTLSGNGNNIDNSFRQIGNTEEVVAMTTAEVVVAVSSATYIVEWRQDIGGAGRYQMATSTGRSFRCWKSS